MPQGNRQTRIHANDSAIDSIENPHELLGVLAGENNACVIVEAARLRLARIRAAQGSDAVVRAFVIGQICRARAAMLRQARKASRGRGEARGDTASGRKSSADASLFRPLAAG